MGGLRPFPTGEGSDFPPLTTHLYVVSVQPRTERESCLQAACLICNCAIGCNTISQPPPLHALRNRGFRRARHSYHDQKKSPFGVLGFVRSYPKHFLITRLSDGFLLDWRTDLHHGALGNPVFEAHKSFIF